MKIILQLTRWRDHIPFVIPLTLIGALLAIYHNNAEPDRRLILVVIGNMLAVSAAFIINDVVDADDDALDPKKRLKNAISSGLTTEVAGLRVFWVFTGTAMVLYTLSGLWVTVWGATGLSLAYLYSANPFRLKSRPVLDLLSHTFGAGGLPLMMGYFLYDDTPGVVWYVVGAMSLMSLYGQFYNQMEDYELDIAAGLRNTSILIGKTAAVLLMRLSVALALACLILAGVNGAFPRWIGTVVLVCIFALLLFPWRRDMRGNVASVDAVQVPALLTLNLTAFLWLAWSLGYLTTGMP